MAENDIPMNDTAVPMTGGDIDPPPASTTFQPAAPLKDAGVGFSPAGETDGGDASGGRVAHAAQGVRDQAAGLREQASDKLRQFAEDGKAKAGGLLDQVAQLLTDAAAQVDEKLGASYGDQARTAAASVQGFAQSVRDKDVDEVADTVRGFIRQSPGAALGIAAALGFVVARVVHAGLDQRD